MMAILVFVIYGVKTATRVSNTAVYVAKCLCVYVKANTSFSDLNSVVVKLRLHGDSLFKSNISWWCFFLYIIVLVYLKILYFSCLFLTFYRVVLELRR